MHYVTSLWMIDNYKVKMNICQTVVESHFACSSASSVSALVMKSHFPYSLKSSVNPRKQAKVAKQKSQYLIFIQQGNYLKTKLHT